MDILPADVFVPILQKLEVQDPVSLLWAVSSCKSFEAAAEENPDLWKEAFHGSAKERSIWSLRNYLTEEGSKLEAEVEALGGYKRVLEDSWADRVAQEFEQNSPAKSESESLPGTSGMLMFNSTSPSFSSSRLLVLVRLLGVLVAYGIHSPEVQTGKVGVRRVANIHLQTLYSFQEIGQALGDIYSEGRAYNYHRTFSSIMSAEVLVHGNLIGRSESRGFWRGSSRDYIDFGPGKVTGHSPVEVQHLGGELLNADEAVPVSSAFTIVDCKSGRKWILTLLEHFVY